MGLQAIFLDRDGTINYDYGYVGEPEKVKIMPGVIDGLKILKKHFPEAKLIVITNQAGVARGIITMEQVNAVNSVIAEILRKEGVEIERFYICPFHPEFSEAEKVRCRKPSPEMVFKAAEDFGLELSETYFIGDKKSDVECGKNAGCKTVLLASDVYGNEYEALKNENNPPDFYAENFLKAVNYIVENEISWEKN